MNIKDSINLVENQIEVLTPDIIPKEDTDLLLIKKPKLPNIPDGNTNLKRISKFSI